MNITTMSNTTFNGTTPSLDTVDPDFAMNRGVDITLSILSIINLILQIPGLHFLDKTRIQHLYIMGLSLSEVLICIVRFTNIVTRMSLQDSGYEKSYIRKVDRYFEYMIFTGLSLLYYISMLMITIDRYMICALSMNYSRYWNRKKARILMYTIGAASLAFYVGVELSYHFTFENITGPIYLFFYLPFDGLFVVTALLTYSRIFYHYVTTARRAHSYSSNTNIDSSTTRASEAARQSKKRSIIAHFKDSKFYVSFLLIATFFLFIVTADLVYLGAIEIGESEYSLVILNVIRISYTVSFLGDGLIYIMLDRRVRKKLFKTLGIDKTPTSSQVPIDGRTDGGISVTRSITS